MKTQPTFTATIWVGMREQYTETIRNLDMAHEYLAKLANEGGLCVTVTPTEFIYKNGREPGFAVGLINYPRFPETPAELGCKAIDIARQLMTLYHQKKVTVVFPDETVMLEAE